MNHPNPEIAQRWQKIVQGDTREFAVFVDQNKNLVTSIAYSAIGDLSGSEDIAQETFLAAWQARQELRDPNKLVSWLSSIARNLAKQWVRKRTAKSWPSTNLDSADISRDAPHPSERLVSDEEEQLVWSALEAIPNDYREVIVLYYRQSHSIADVALALEITEETARQRLSRGRGLLRAEVERSIESTLANSRPTANFTAGVISIITASTWSSAVGKSAMAATAGLIGQAAVQGTVVTATQAATAGAIAGAATGAVGAIGGLGGTWLGIRVPQWMAPTMTERKLLEREGRFIWRLSLGFVFASLVSVAVALLFATLPNVVMYIVLGNMLMAICFAAVCIIRGMGLNQQIKHIRQTINPDEDPNPTWIKDRMGLSTEPSKAKWVGRRSTSQRRVFGWPIYDFQVSDPTLSQMLTSQLHARGWIAIGDKATGFLAVGNHARGIFAFGGRSLGVISMGGLSIGLVSVGGAALGLLSIGGLAIGHSAIGGGGIGWQAAGGGAVGVYSANGGLALSGNIAEGGLAISMKYAVGGLAKAPEANTEVARLECGKSWVADYVNTQLIVNNPYEFQKNVMIYGTVVPVAFSLLFAIGVPLLMYRRKHES